ncbi:MAG: hypothetical protein QXS81_01500, partial [Candidatus Micrarchaeaceae archaeon]
LTYGQFSPSYSFQLNATNNPAVPLSISLTQFKLIPSNVLPAAPYTRNLTAIRSYSENTKLPLNTNTSYNLQILINNYALPSKAYTVLNGAANSVMVYMPNDTFINPPVSLFNQTLFSTAGNGYYGRENNLYPITESAGTWQTFNIYLPQVNTSSPYGMAISGCTGAPAAGDYMQVLSGPQGSQLQVQQEQIPNSPSFSVYLVNSYLYQFNIYSPSKALIYSSAISSWTSPIDLAVPCNTTVTPIPLPNVNATCTWKNGASNTLLATCSGRDLSGLVSKWKVYFINQTSVLTSTTLASYVINSSTFSVSYTFPSNKTSYQARIVAYYGRYVDPTQVFTVLINPTGAFATSDLALLTILFILAPIAMAYFDKNLMLIVYIVFIFAGQALGSIFTFLGYTVFDVWVFIIFSLIMLIVSELR